MTLGKAIQSAPIVLLFVLGCAHHQVHTPVLHADIPSYTIRRAPGPITVDGKVEEPSWGRADTIQLIFPWWDQSKGPKDKTDVKLLWDNSNLYISYVAKDPHISAYVSRRDGKTYEDDCVEAFIAPDPDYVEDYYGFEINAKGVVYDYHREPGTGLDPGWDAEGIQVAVQIHGTLNNDADRDTMWVAEVAIPFASLPGDAPESEAVWRLNLSRCGGEAKCQFSQWSSSKTDRPNFHVPDRFGQAFFGD